MSDPVTLTVCGPPVPGVNARITAMHALWMQTDDATLTVSSPDDAEAMFPDVHFDAVTHDTYARWVAEGGGS